MRIDQRDGAIRVQHVLPVRTAKEAQAGVLVPQVKLNYGWVMVTVRVSAAVKLLRMVAALSAASSRTLRRASIFPGMVLPPAAGTAEYASVWLWASEKVTVYVLVGSDMSSPFSSRIKMTGDWSK